MCVRWCIGTAGRISRKADVAAGRRRYHGRCPRRIASRGRRSGAQYGAAARGHHVQVDSEMGAFQMDYRVEVACWDQDGRYRPLDVQDVAANSELEAAEKLCGKGLLDRGNHGRLAATVWPRGTTNPWRKRFYRAP
jgi:hypothetical protein